MHTSRYRISSQNTRLEVNDTWERFAVENGLPTLAPSQVLGQSLWRFISGLEVQHLYALLLHHVRHTQRNLTLE